MSSVADIAAVTATAALMVWLATQSGQQVPSAWRLAAWLAISVECFVLVSLTGALALRSILFIRL